MIHNEFTLDEVRLYSYLDQIKKYLDKYDFVYTDTRTAMVIELIYLYSHLPTPTPLTGIEVARLITNLTGEVINKSEYIGKCVYDANSHAGIEIIKHLPLKFLKPGSRRGYIATLSFPQIQGNFYQPS